MKWGESHAGHTPAEEGERAARQDNYDAKEKQIDSSVPTHKGQIGDKVFFAHEKGNPRLGIIHRVASNGYVVRHPKDPDNKAKTQEFVSIRHVHSVERS